MPYIGGIGRHEHPKIGVDFDLGYAYNSHRHQDYQ
jgi:hypothetical protein